MLRSGSAVRHKYLFQVVQFWNKVAFQLLVLPKLVRENDYVVLDRWDLSFYIYGLVAGINPLLLKFAHWFLKKPDVTVVLFGSPYPKENLDSYESDRFFQQCVDIEYQAWGLKHHRKSCLVDVNGKSPQEVHDLIVGKLEVKNTL